MPCIGQGTDIEFFPRLRFLGFVVPEGELVLLVVVAGVFVRLPWFQREENRGL